MHHGAKTNPTRIHASKPYPRRVTSSQRRTPGNDMTDATCPLTSVPFQTLALMCVTNDPVLLKRPGIN